MPCTCVCTLVKYEQRSRLLLVSRGRKHFTLHSDTSCSLTHTVNVHVYVCVSALNASCYRVRLYISPIIVIDTASMWRKSAKNISVSYLSFFFLLSFFLLSSFFFLSLPPTPPSSINKKWGLRTSPQSSLLSLIFLSLTRFAQGNCWVHHTHTQNYINKDKKWQENRLWKFLQKDWQIHSYSLSRWHSRRWQHTCTYTPCTRLMMSWCFCLMTEHHCSLLVRAWVFLVFPCVFSLTAWCYACMSSVRQYC